jgi:hypothetical protein
MVRIGTRAEANYARFVLNSAHTPVGLVCAIRPMAVQFTPRQLAVSTSLRPQPALVERDRLGSEEEPR